MCGIFFRVCLRAVYVTISSGTYDYVFTIYIYIYVYIIFAHDGMSLLEEMISGEDVVPVLFLLYIGT